MVLNVMYNMLENVSQLNWPINLSLLGSVHLYSNIVPNISEIPYFLKAELFL